MSQVKFYWCLNKTMLKDRLGVVELCFFLCGLQMVEINKSAAHSGFFSIWCWMTEGSNCGYFWFIIQKIKCLYFIMPAKHPDENGVFRSVWTSVGENCMELRLKAWPISPIHINWYNWLISIFSFIDSNKYIQY